MKHWAVILFLATGTAASATSDVGPDPSGAPASAEAASTARPGDPDMVSLRPQTRPRKFEAFASNRDRMQARGAICGDWEIQGEPVGRVRGKWRGCGMTEAVRVHTVAGIALSQSSLMDCRTAAALRTWVEDTAKPVLANEGGGLKSLRVVSHYFCKTRNNQPGARISEHGRGRALDISAFELKDGSAITIAQGWNDEQAGDVVRQLHEGACGPFGTVLGPDSDRFHTGHFHLDTARYRDGPYCR